VNPDRFSRAPYPGLRSFRREETDLFFGREDCVGSMVDRLRDTRFLAVLGSSGTGKSSVVKTGLLDALEVGLMASAGSNWRVVEFRPGGAPLNNLARHLLEADEPAGPVSDADVALLRGFLARGPRAIIEWCRDGNLPKGTNLLLLVDQFEELFRYQGYAGREEAEALVALLLESAHSPEFPIYVTITMRSEYLGACTLIQGLAEAISAGMVLTPRMTREQCRTAIEGPAGVCRTEIEPPLVSRLLNDLANFAPWDQGGNNDQLDRLSKQADQLPLLQYTLNRMWLQARERWVNGGWMDSGPLRLRLSEYGRIGGLTGALNWHAEQILKDLAEQGLERTVEAVFRALITGTTAADAVRRPTTFGQLVALAGGNREAVRRVVDTFRAPGCNFLTPELDPKDPKPLSDDTPIDISHESLIRQWKKLSDWLAIEARAAQNWRRLKDNVAAKYRVRGEELADLTAWRNDFKPNEPWASRYGGEYTEAIALLNASEREEKTERRGKMLARGGVAFAAVLAILGTVWMIQQQQITDAKEAEQNARKMEATLQVKYDQQAQELKDAQDQALTTKEQALAGAQDALQKISAQNAQLVDSNTVLKSENDALKTKLAALEQGSKPAGGDAQLQSEYVALKAQIEALALAEKDPALKAKLQALASSMKVAGPAQPAIALGLPPVLDAYAGEADDLKVDPPVSGGLEVLQKNIDSPTPTTLPGGQVLTTKQVYEALASGKLKGKAFLIVDVWDDQQHLTIPTAQRLPYAGAGGEFTDDVQLKMFDDMKKMIKSGDWTVPVIFFGKDAKNWQAYNASLRSIEMGNTLVYWYRGGLASWLAAGQPVEASPPANKPGDSPKGTQ
jgi:hypothetical protein